MKVLFVLFHDFTSNSAYHVHSLANELSGMGCACSVAVPQGRATISGIGTKPRYACYEFDECAALRPDIVHCWTPREAVRRVYERMPAWQGVPLIIHLEDNEEEIAARFLGEPFEDLVKLPLKQLDKMVSPTITHPVRGPQFLRQADGVTLVLEKLKDHVPPGKPCVVLSPSADEELFTPRQIQWERRSALGIPDTHTVIVYSGNVHGANRWEVRSLYLAVAMLNREGHATTLVRTGRDYTSFLDGGWARSIELGFVERKELPEILAMANLFVQPGKPGAFNDYRFPSKIPEFCAIGRPLILPASNVGLAMRHLDEAYIVPTASATAIVEAVVDIRRDAALEARLAAGSRRFFDEQLRWRQSASKLLDFYNLFRLVAAAERNH